MTQNNNQSFIATFTCYDLLLYVDPTFDVTH